MPTPTTASGWFDVFAPALASDSLKDAYLDFAATQMASATVWGNVYYQAVALLAAHMLTRLPSDPAASANASEATGGYTSRSVLTISESRGTAFTAKTAADAELATTRFGLLYMRLRDSRAAGSARVVVPT